MTIPASPSSAQTFESSAAAFTPTARILIVDDNSSKRTALKAALAPLGHAVVEADSGIAALRCVMKDDFAVILMDVQMPDMDGFETAELIRERWQSELTPIMFVTAYTRDEIDRPERYVGGAVDFIFTPIPPSELRSKVSFIIHVFLDAQRLVAQSEEVQALQRNFAASASHELRTPTASIVGYIEEVLLSTTIEAEDRGLLEIAYRNSKRLSMLIDDLMLLDQCEIGAPTMNLEATALIPLVERVHSTLAAAAADNDIQLCRDYDEAAPSAFADPARLEQALTNLVSNAVKFTPNGGSVTVAVRAGDGGQVVVAVTDTGMGIEPADCSRIFERFYRSRSATDSAIPGSGLGLAIAKVMVEAQAGSIAVTSRPGWGSTFSVALPAFVEQHLLSGLDPVVTAKV